MGWNYYTADWSVVADILYPGGAHAPAFWTFVGIVGFVAILWAGNRTEQAKYKMKS